LRDVVGPRPSGRGVVDSKFSEANRILSKFYARVQSFGYFFADRKVARKKLITKTLYTNLPQMKRAQAINGLGLQKDYFLNPHLGSREPR